MRTPAKKKAGRVRSERPARVEPVVLTARYRNLLARARAIIGTADEYLDEIKNNLQRGEQSEYGANVAGLRRIFGDARRLHPFLKNLERHAQRGWHDKSERQTCSLVCGLLLRGSGRLFLGKFLVRVRRVHVLRVPGDALRLRR